jgi:hypothetical protein
VRWARAAMTRRLTAFLRGKSLQLLFRVGKLNACSCCRGPRGGHLGKTGPVFLVRRRRRGLEGQTLGQPVFRTAHRAGCGRGSTATVLEDQAHERRSAWTLD